MKPLTEDLIKFQKIVDSYKTEKHIICANKYRQNLFRKYKNKLNTVTGMDLHFQMLYMIKKQENLIKSST